MEYFLPKIILMKKKKKNKIIIIIIIIIIIYQNKIKYLTIAFNQDFDQNFTLIAFLCVIHITAI